MAGADEIDGIAAERWRPSVLMGAYLTAPARAFALVRSRKENPPARIAAPAGH